MPSKGARRGPFACLRQFCLYSVRHIRDYSAGDSPDQDLLCYFHRRRCSDYEIPAGSISDKTANLKNCLIHTHEKKLIIIGFISIVVSNNIIANNFNEISGFILTE